MLRAGGDNRNTTSRVEKQVYICVCVYVHECIQCFRIYLSKQAWDDPFTLSDLKQKQHQHLRGTVGTGRLSKQAQLLQQEQPV